MRFVDCSVVFQEVPGEVSLAFLISGCPNSCKNCHSEFAKDPETGIELTEELLSAKIEEYKDSGLTCVLFLGGDWDESGLSGLLKVVKSAGLKSCLYTGRKVPKYISWDFDYVKYGPYIEDLGGLQSRTTNQRFIDVGSGEDITSKFWRD